MNQHKDIGLNSAIVKGLFILNSNRKILYERRKLISLFIIKICQKIIILRIYFRIYTFGFKIIKEIKIMRFHII